MPHGRTPKPGEIFTNQALGRTLEAVAATRGETFYRGKLAHAIARHAAEHDAALGLADLAHHTATWCAPLDLDIHGAVLHELPPNGQGICALIALGLLRHTAIAWLPPDSAEAIHLQIEAMKLGFADLHRYVAAPEAMTIGSEALLGPDYLAERASLIAPGRARLPGHGAPRMGGTVYVTAADASGMMVSLIQSNYGGFGSGVVVPGTGIHLHNRGSGFSLQAGHPNQVAPGKRPLHTIIPGFITQDGQPLMSLGVVGGPMQPQAHVQLVLRTLVHRQNPQSAIDAPRWRIGDNRKVLVEWAMPDAVVERLSAWGHEVQRENPIDSFGFGCAQIIRCLEDGYVAGSDSRRDGLALGL